MGAFLGGIMVESAPDLEWIKEHPRPFRILLVAFFFLGVGAVLDIGFLSSYLGTVLALVAVAMVTNTVINGLILRIFGLDWRKSWYGGAVLAGIGEFSFVLVVLGVRTGVITDFAYQLTVATIAVTMVASPIWIRLFHRGETVTAEP
jgi:CPA2 family monovalent cation:H+ antiporter-2